MSGKGSLSSILKGITSMPASTRTMIIIATMAAVAGILIVTSSGGGENTLFSSNVTVFFGEGNITVHAQLPGPMTTTYYYYYYYYSRPVPSMNVSVIVVAEKIERGVPQLVRFTKASANAYSSTGNWVDVSFTNLQPGIYRVKVYYWNGLLKDLGTNEWRPLGVPYTIIGSVS